jgi:hypothetical protein
MATWDEKGHLLTMTPEESEQAEVYGVYPEPPAKKVHGESLLKYPIGHEPPLDDDDLITQPPKVVPPIGREKESLLLRSYSATLSTDGDLKNLSQVLSQKAHKSISHSAIIRALVQLAAHDPASIPKILSYVLHEEIKPGRK